MLKIGAVWVAELLILFAVAESLAVLFLPPGLHFYHPQKLVQPSPRRIYEYQPNQRSFTIDKPFVTNTFGFRDEREVPADKDGEIRILSLGDSIAEGLGVSAEETYVRKLEARLERRYGRVRVINAAVGSYSTWQEVDLLKEKGIGLAPDIVVLAFYWNDLYVKPAVVVPLSRSRSDVRKDAMWQYVRLFKRSRVLSYLRERFDIVRHKIFPSSDWILQEMIYEGRSSPYLDQAYAEVGASLQEFGSLGELHGFAPVLVIFPIPGQVPRPDPPTHLQQRIRAMATGAGVEIIDLLPIMQEAFAESPDLYIPWDNNHLSPRGHEMVAKVLEQYLADNGFVRRQVLHRPPDSRPQEASHESKARRATARTLDG